MEPKTLMATLKAQAHENRRNCLTLAWYHRGEARSYQADPNSRGYHKLRAAFWLENARYWKTHLPNS